MFDAFGSAFSDHFNACILNSLPTKSQRHQSRYTISDHLQLETNLTKSPNPMIFSISEQTFPKLSGQLMPMTEVISVVITLTETLRHFTFETLKYCVGDQQSQSYLNREKVPLQPWLATLLVMVSQ